MYGERQRSAPRTRAAARTAAAFDGGMVGRVTGRRLNLALLLLLAVAFVSGWVAFTLSGDRAGATLLVHGSAGVGVLLLVPWKTRLSTRSIGRRRHRTLWWPSLVVAAGIAISIAAGLAHSAGRPYLGAGLTAMEFHVGAALAVLPFAVWHLWARPVRLRPADLSRRSFTAGLLLSTASVAGLRLLPSADRAPTGSYPASAPVPTVWMFDPVPNLQTQSWRLIAGGRAWTYEELARFDDRIRARLDCTGGWWTESDWSGAWVQRLLSPPPASGSYLVRSATGYQRRFPPDEPLLIALNVDGGALPAGNGFPARLVAPRRRGFEWVKWVVEVRSEGAPAWWQLPFPAQ
jgi:molybdopterin-dependent oxidoreductase-like protein protein